MNQNLVAQSFHRVQMRLNVQPSGERMCELAERFVQVATGRDYMLSVKVIHLATGFEDTGLSATPEVAAQKPASRVKFYLHAFRLGFAWSPTLGQCQWFTRLE